MTPDDQQLLERIRGGDTQAFAEYLQQCQPRVLAYIERQLGTALRRRVEPDDLFQEISIDCVRSLPDIDLSQRDPFGWMCQMVDRRIVDAHRRYFGTQKRDAGREVRLGGPGGPTGQAGLINMLAASMTSPSRAFSRNQREFHLMQAVESLPEEQRQALHLRYVENLPTKEISQRLDKSDVAVRVMLTRSLRKLQQLLGDET